MRKTRFKAWYRIVNKSMGITQQDLRKVILTKNNTPNSQARISQLMSGTVFNMKNADELQSHFPFTVAEFYLKKSNDILDVQKLFHFIEKRNMTKISSILKSYKKLTIDSEDEKLQKAFNAINDKFGYDFNIKAIRAEIRSFDHDISENPPPENLSGYLSNVIRHVVDTGRMNTKAEFAEKILRIAPSHLSNIMNQNNPQQVSKNMLISIASKAPYINLRYLLLGEPPMMMPDKDPVTVDAEMLQAFEVIRKGMNKKGAS